jgi:hypothetical protein
MERKNSCENCSPVAGCQEKKDSALWGYVRKSPVLQDFQIILFRSVYRRGWITDHKREWNDLQGRPFLSQLIHFFTPILSEIVTGRLAELLEWPACDHAETECGRFSRASERRQMRPICNKSRRTATSKTLRQ